MKIKNELLRCDIQFPKVSHLHKNRDVTLLEMCIALCYTVSTSVTLPLSLCDTFGNYVIL